jgi:peptidoglycan/LPS O-acetylase OafA/YrhL
MSTFTRRQEVITPCPTSRRPGSQTPWHDGQRHRRLVRLGQALMALGVLVVVVVVHLVMHLSTSPSGWVDLTLGSPTGALLALAGAMLAGRSKPKAKR